MPKKRICNDLQKRSEERKIAREQELAAINKMMLEGVANKRQCEEVPSVRQIGALPIMAGAWDKFELTEVIDSILHKVGPHAKIGYGDLCKAFALQSTGSGFLSLSNTEEYFGQVDTEVLFNKGVDASCFNRYALGRTLDEIHEYGTTKFFGEIASAIMSRQGKSVSTVHIDSTSVHFHGSPQEEGSGTIGITFGYSRDGHPELPQVNVIGLADHQSGLPVFYKGVSGNENDKKSFLDVLCNDAEQLKKTCPGVTHIVGDSALCTAEICAATRKADLHVITKMPLTNSLAKQYIYEADTSKFTDIYSNSPNKKERGQWCPEIAIGSVQVKALLVENPALRKKHRKKIQKDAEKEKAGIEKDLKKISSMDHACVEDAKRAVEKRLKKCLLCRVENATYEEIWKNSKRGRPRAGEVAEKKLVGVTVTADIVIDEEAVAKKTEISIRSLIITTDVTHPWTMEELLSTYRGQSVIESSWKLFKDKRLMAESIYLSKPERIEALLCLLYLVVLLLKVTEILLREGMEKNSLALPPLSNEAPATRPTISRMIDYTRNQHITLVVGSGEQGFININNNLFEIFASMGAHWLRYYIPESYSQCKNY